MNKRERVIAAIEGKEVDGIPTSFSLHFPAAEAVGDPAVEAHLKFFEDTDTDIVKVMNENLIRQYDMVYTPKEFNSAVKRLTDDRHYITDQIEMTKKIVDRADPEAFTMGTLHGITASAIHVIGHMGEHYPWYAERQIVTDFCRWDPAAMEDAYKRIADYMSELATAYVKESGVESIYYASLGGETRWHTDEEFERFIKPGDLQIMDAIREAGAYVFLHVCKDHIGMERYRDYADHFDVVNWGVYEVPFSMEQGRELWPGKTILGGLANRTGAITESAEAAIAAAQKVVDDFGRTGLIIGADCTIATDQDRSIIKALAEACRKM